MKTADDIRSWLVSQVARELGLEPQALDVRAPLSRFGLDSVASIGLACDLEDWLGRPVPPELLSDYPSIDTLARRLASGSTASAPGPAPPVAASPSAEAQLAPSSRWDQVVQGLTGALVKALVRVDVEGLDRLPPSGPVLLAINHLHVFDAPVLFGVVRRPMAFFVSEHMREAFLVDWFLNRVGRPIYVSRGEADRGAIDRALATLRSGGTLVMAPEGRISRTGGLLKGQTGAAYLATEAPAPIVPVVAHGQERAFRQWLRLRRVPVRLRVGERIELPPGRASARELETHSEGIMRALARLLPPEYRGVYASAVEKEPIDIR